MVKYQKKKDKKLSCEFMTDGFRSIRVIWEGGKMNFALNDEERADKQRREGR